MSAPGLAAHLSPAELGQRYRAARSPAERSHLQIVWLLSQGRGERAAAAGGAGPRRTGGPSSSSGWGAGAGAGGRGGGSLVRGGGGGGSPPAATTRAGRTAWATGGAGTPAPGRCSGPRTRRR